MNERACAFVCWLLTTICMILSLDATFTGNRDGMLLVCVFGGVAVLIAGFVIVYRFVN